MGSKTEGEGRRADHDDSDVVAAVRAFVEREVITNASGLEHRDEYPHAMVATMKQLGLFGATIPVEHGGLGLSFLTYAKIMEELSRGWMSLAGVINSHLILAYIVTHHGTVEQRARLLPAMACGDKRGGLALTEPHAGSDVQSIRTVAKRSGDNYHLDGTKMFITNARYGTTLAVAAKTDPNAKPPYRGISMFAVDKSHRGPVVGRNLKKIGYKGIDTCEVLFVDLAVPAANLIGGVEGEGFKQVMAALEVGRINVAARAVGVARAAFETAIRYAQQRTTFGKPICEHQAVQIMLADMATRLEASRLMVHSAATKKDSGERCDLEAGMAKLFASESCAKISLDAMRVLGGYGFTEEFPVERFYRDAPLMMIGEGTNEIQSIVIARNLLQRHRL
ncbi:MAG TPA: acyl-CoA dehydrogenase family protein [Candidatus Binataceae bacterium]|jgi:alkylation response protein AidB-like acyl-CoA dehydrogenase